MTDSINMEKLSDEARLVAAAQAPDVRQRMIETLIYPYPLFKDGDSFIGKFHCPVVGGTHGRGKIGGLRPNKVLDPLGDTKTEFEQFCMLLDGIDNRLPFAAKSGLANDRIAKDIHRHSDGLIGRVMELVQAAAFDAINDGTDSILIEHLQSAADRLLPSNDAYRYFRGV